MEVGDEWIYRAKTFDPSERVKILAMQKLKQTTRVDIEFLDGGHAGTQKNVPGSRLHGPWSRVSEYDKLMANRLRLSSCDLDEVEESAVSEVFDALIPKEIAKYYDSFNRNGTTVRDRDALERLMHQPMSDILEQVGRLV
ncbi:hypothetical protein [Mycobacterium sp. 1245852.3]|uniref:hypothetical protein n=1 Tax=Mycobacterium sp. 1245852.3 TaxID=1856860 RepID=UPI001E62C416|nr:hypothetical protein [Mycobacterium sp. 1245852.3]